MKTAILSLLATALFASALGGCVASYDRTDITDVAGGGDVSTSPTVNHQQIRIAEGTVVTARFIPYNDDGNAMVGEVDSDNVDVIATARAPNNKWALIGAKPGHAHIMVTADGNTVTTIDAEVVAQE